MTASTSRYVTPDERAAILEAAATGASRYSIAKTTGRSPRTVARIAEAAGIRFDSGPTENATRAAVASMAARRAALAGRLVDEVGRLLGELRAPMVERKAMVVAGRVEVVEVVHGRPLVHR